MEQLLQKQMESTQLLNHFNNIAEFAKHNDVDAFDYIQNIRKMYKQNKDVHFEEQYVRGLLMNLELLAHKWGLINTKKYLYRLSAT